MNINGQQGRARRIQLQQELTTAMNDYENGHLSKKAFKARYRAAKIEADSIDTRLKAARYASWGSPGEHQGALGNFDPVTKSVPNRPFHISDAQIKSLFRAAEQRMPMSIDLSTPSGAYAAGYSGGGITETRLKAFGGVTESGIGGSIGTGQLPPMQTQFAVGLGYESTRVSSLLPGAEMLGPAAAWLSHTGNTTEVTGVPELGTKEDIGAKLSENVVYPQKIAGLAALSLESWLDTESYGPASLATWLPQELTRSLINAESEYLLMASTAETNPLGSGPVSATFNGWLNTSGTLTRAMGSDAPFDCLSKAIIDLRVGSGFCDADLILLHPSTMGALRREKDSENRYVMDLLAGPLGLSADGSPRVNTTTEISDYAIQEQGSPAAAGHIWGVPVAMSTQVPAGTAIVASIKAGAGVFWQRLGLVLTYNWLGDAEFSTNYQTFRVEERVALSVPRPAALNIVTGLPTS